MCSRGARGPGLDSVWELSQPASCTPKSRGWGQACRRELLLSKHLLGDACTGSVGLPLQIGEARVLPPLALASPAGPRRAKVHSRGSLHISHKLGVLPTCKKTPRFQDTSVTNQRASHSSPDPSLPQGSAQLAHCRPATKGADGKAELPTPVPGQDPEASSGASTDPPGRKAAETGARGRLLPCLQLDWAPAGPQLRWPDPSADWCLCAPGAARAKGSGQVELFYWSKEDLATGFSNEGVSSPGQLCSSCHVWSATAQTRQGGRRRRARSHRARPRQRTHLLGLREASTV